MSTEQNLELVGHVDALPGILKSQYRAGLAMLREAIEQCPEDLWYSTEPTNAFWQVAYHVLFFTHLYLQPDEQSFRPWKHHQSNCQHPDGIPDRADPNSPLPLIPIPYTKAQALEYCQFCTEMVETAVDALDLRSPNSGFHWYPISKLEHQIVNIRHIQHHTAQLADRLRAATNFGVRWAGARPAVSR
jgi:hypothetical protein